jgi:predicted RNA-binding Zn ribbon-like protein
MKHNANPARRKPAPRLTDGGNHALNFINTFRKDRKGHYFDLLTDYGSLLNWAEQANLINWDRFLLLDRECHNDVDDAKSSYREARGLRLCLDELFNDLVAGQQVYHHALTRFNEYAVSIRPYLRYEYGVTGLQLYWHNLDETLTCPFTSS